ncbi:hypothetical protein ACO0QE_002278 [Hanseniaspora vineae]
MFNIAKKLVKTFEQSVSETLNTNGSASATNDSYFQSIPPNLLQYPNDYRPTIDTLHGLRVVQCDETQLQLHTFFDYIIGINDEPLPIYFNTHGWPFPNYNEIYRIINSSLLHGSDAASKYVKLNVWSGKGGFYRDEYIQLTQINEMQDVSLDDDGSTGQDSASVVVKPLFESLGFQIQWQPLIGSTFTYHILSITDNYGTAARVGLVPQKDYIIGCQDGLLSTGGETLLQDILKAKCNQDLVLYVYNSDKDFVRPITVSLNGTGKLGCNVGYGYLHRIPVPQGVLSTNSLQNSDIINPIAQTMHQQPSDLPPLDPSSTFQPMQFQQTIIAPVPTTFAPKKKKHVQHGAANQASTSLLNDLQEKEPQPAYSSQSANSAATTSANGLASPPPSTIAPPPTSSTKKTAESATPSSTDSDSHETPL